MNTQNTRPRSRHFNGPPIPSTNSPPSFSRQIGVSSSSTPRQSKPMTIDEVKKLFQRNLQAAFLPPANHHPTLQETLEGNTKSNYISLLVAENILNTLEKLQKDYAAVASIQDLYYWHYSSLLDALEQNTKEIKHLCPLNYQTQTHVQAILGAYSRTLQEMDSTLNPSLKAILLNTAEAIETFKRRDGVSKKIETYLLYAGGLILLVSIPLWMRSGTK